MYMSCYRYLNISDIYAFGFYCFFFFNDTATTEIYTLSLHDALPISQPAALAAEQSWLQARAAHVAARGADRKSTRLNSSHGYISYAVFCLKKKKKTIRQPRHSKKIVTNRQLT